MILAMSSGFRIRRSRGVMCRVIRVCSRVDEFWIDVKWFGSGPRCVVRSMNRV